MRAGLMSYPGFSMTNHRFLWLLGPPSFGNVAPKDRHLFPHGRHPQVPTEGRRLSRATLAPNVKTMGFDNTPGDGGTTNVNVGTNEAFWKNYSYC